MALVTKLDEGIKGREGIHKSTECTYYIVTDKKNRKYLQLDTYGSKDRQIPGKISQSIQLSPEAIKELVKILKKEALLG